MSRFLTFFLFLFLFLSLFFSVSVHNGHHDNDEDAGGSHEEEATNLKAKPLILVKVWCLIIIFFAIFIDGVSSYILKWNEGFLVLGTQFAGGVFLGTTMMYFLTDANKIFGDLTHKE